MGAGSGSTCGGGGAIALAESRREARTDDLTGLANRRLLIELLADSVDGSDEAAVLMVAGLDDFKEVNDSLGHVGGDELLKEVGQRLANLARRRCRCRPPTTRSSGVVRGGRRCGRMMPCDSRPTVP